MRLAAHLYAVELREGMWAVIVECATGSGWQRVELRAGPELLAAINGEPRPGRPCSPNDRSIWPTASTTDTPEALAWATISDRKPGW